MFIFEGPIVPYVVHYWGKQSYRFLCPTIMKCIELIMSCLVRFKIVSITKLFPPSITPYHVTVTLVG